MNKLEKKKAKLKERINVLEFELKNTLQKKAQGNQINIQDYNTKILLLKKELNDMK